MPRKPRFGHLKGSPAYFPFAARTALRKKQRRSIRLLRGAGAVALALALALAARQTLFRGGQPASPIAATPAPTAAASGPATVPITVRPATADLAADALAATEQSDAEAHTAPEPQPTPDAAPEEGILPQYQALYAQNPDLVGWLYIEGTNIDYPVVQAPGDNQYYLRRGFDRLYATGGTLFVDERCRLGNAPTANWLVYGHNMADGSMFGTLDAYADEAFYLAHPTFRFDTLTEEAQWQVVAVLRTTLGADELPYYAFFDASSRAEWQAWIDALLGQALYETGITPEYGSQLLTLSTCGTASANTDQRLAVLAVRVEAP